MILYEITVYEMCVKNPLGGTQFSRISAFLGIHHFHRAVVLSVSGTLAGRCFLLGLGALKPLPLFGCRGRFVPKGGNSSLIFEVPKLK